MILFAQIMLIIWPLLTLYWFQNKDPREAVLLSFIMGTLFLPNYMIDIPLIVYNKNAAIAVGILLGEAVSQKKIEYEKTFFDRIVIIYCFISAILTSVINGYGLYEGIVVGLSDFFLVGVVFITGRRYFRTDEDLKLLMRYILIGVLIYIPLVLYELRMSPQLHIKVYGFFQHSWVQHFRYGGYRPIVFMLHGLMVSLWLMVGTVSFFWLWRGKEESTFLNIPVLILFIICFAALFLSKSKGALALGMLGITFWLFYKRKIIALFFSISVIIIFVYFLLRIFNIITIDDLANLLSRVFDEERMSSVIFRFRSEDIISQNMNFGQVLFGKHRWGRGLGENPYTGRAVVVDSLWIITYGARGFLGLFSLFALILAGPISLLKNLRAHVEICIEAVIFGLIVILFGFDCLVNAHINPVYLLCSGALVSYSKAMSQAIYDHSRFSVF